MEMVSLFRRRSAVVTVIIGTIALMQFSYVVAFDDHYLIVMMMMTMIVMMIVMMIMILMIQ